MAQSSSLGSFAGGGKSLGEDTYDLGDKRRDDRVPMKSMSM